MYKGKRVGCHACFISAPDTMETPPPTHQTHHIIIGIIVIIPMASSQDPFQVAMGITEGNS